MKKFKQVTALAAVIAWVMLLITTFIMVLLDTEYSHQLFLGLLYTDIVLPIIVYAMMLVYKFLSKKKK